MIERNQRLSRLFLPHLIERAQPVIDGKRLVHYTTAEAAYKIVTGKQLWLRNATLMNDYSEMRHGMACLQAGWISEPGQGLQRWLDAKLPGFREELEQTFNSHVDSLTNSTFMLSLSEHDDDEDNLGRLSMWRAYGGRSGVALVLNPTVFSSETDEIKAFSAPVVYRDEVAFVAWFAGWVRSLQEHEALLFELPRDELLWWLFYTFRTFVLCTKHPGFREEREWRVFHTPSVDQGSEWLEPAIEVVNGVPQHVIKLGLFDKPDAGVTGVDPKTLINRAIIGPCENPIPIRNAMGAALSFVGIEDYGSKIWMSFIPLRQR